MGIQAIYSTQDGAAAAVADLRRQAGALEPKLVIYFASSRYEQQALCAAMRQAFAQAALVGCSTAGELVSGKMLKGSVAAMLFDADALADVAVEVVEKVKNENRIDQALQGFAKHFGVPLVDLDARRYVGIILIDGLSMSEEKLMETLGDRTNITFIGGSAGDDLAFRQTHVYADGRAYSDAAVLVVLEPAAGFDVIKTQSFEPTEVHLVATEVDAATRTVSRFNDQPAAAAYAAALGVEEAEVSQRFMSSPLGLMVGDEPYVRSPQRVNDGRMMFYCSIRQGMDLRVMRSTDIVADTRQAVEAKRTELGSVAGILNFHCILRTLELEQRGECDAYGGIFSGVPTIGFSTYGEEYIGHINQTSTMLVLR